MGDRGAVTLAALLSAHAVNKFRIEPVYPLVGLQRRLMGATSSAAFGLRSAFFNPADIVSL